jgi:NADPH:quinone reductase-like Zn-dependent oxidoreductase
VDALGPDVRSLGVGQRVMGIVGGGGYAEAVIAPEAEVLRVPTALDLVEAGAVPEVFLTAWDALVRQLGLGGGETLLVHAAGSGVGTAAIQIGRALGARVLGTSRTPDKLERAAGLGMERGFVGGADTDWPEQVLEATDGRGADVILDLLGGPYAPGNLRAIAERGRWIVVGVPAGRGAELDLRALMAKRASVRGTVLRARLPEEKALLARAAEHRLLPLLARGALRPVVDVTFPPEQAADAHRRMEADLNFGKLLIVWT